MVVLDEDCINILTAAETAEQCQEAVRLLKAKLLKSNSPCPEPASPSPDQYIDFFKYGHDIKETERRGWVLFGIKDGETVACHMYRMGLMAIALDMPNLDMNRCLQMALIHDLAEAIVGDITPECGTSRDEKSRLENEAISKISSTLGDNKVAEKIKDLWLEYELNETVEASFVHDLDKLELALQTFEYEKKYQKDLSKFIHSASARIKHPKLCLILDRIIERRALPIVVNSIIQGEEFHPPG